MIFIEINVQHIHVHIKLVSFAKLCFKQTTQ